MNIQAPIPAKASFYARISSRTWLGLLLALAFTLRFGSYLALRNAIHPDEIFQVTEQAYRAVFGYGVLPWEFREGARGWLWPGTIAGLFEAIKWVIGPGAVGATAVAAFCSLISLIGVAAMFALGRRISRTHAIIAGFAGATWVDFVYFAPHPLTEVVAASFLLAGLALASDGANARRALFIGLCFGACFVMRFHLAPGLAVAAVWFARTKVRQRWLPLIAGGLVVLMAYGAIDWITWGVPFVSIYKNFRANLVEGRAAIYGTAPPAAYLKYLLTMWGGAFAFLAVLVGIGTRRYPMLLAVALTIVLTHSFIAHKEYRFIFPAIACLITLAAIGTADFVQFLVHHVQGDVLKRDLFPGALAIWGVTSVIVALSPAFEPLWSANRPAIAAFSAVGRDSSLCGLALISEPHWTYTPGYSGLHRNVPIYEPVDLDPAKLELISRAFNFVLAPEAQSPPKGFSPVKCFSAPGVKSLCLSRRAGACTAQPDQEINRLLVKYDQ